jgi:hypothetical protein
MQGFSWKSPAVLTALLVLLASAGGLAFAIDHYKLMLRKEAIYPRGGALLNSIPDETDNWVRQGPDRRENAETEAVLGTVNYVSRMYAQKNSDTPVMIDFHAAYYTGMIDTVPHVPDRCLVGGGLALGGFVGDVPIPMDQSRWTAIETADGAGKLFSVRTPNFSTRAGTRVVLPRNPQDLKLRIFEFKSPRGKPFYSGYFFIANGGWVSNAEEVRLLAFDLRTKYAYYTKVQFTGFGLESGEELAKHAASMLDELLPDIMHCLPDWQAVERGEVEGMIRAE